MSGFVRFECSITPSGYADRTWVHTTRLLSSRRRLSTPSHTLPRTSALFIEGGLRSNIKMGAGLGEALARATGQARTDLRTTALGIFRGLARSYEVTLDVATAAQDRRWKKWLVDNAKLRRGEVVLDIGCGTCILEERLGAVGCYFVGVDITVEMARIGISKGLNSIQGIVVADAESLPFRDGCFDAVLSCGALKYCNEARLAAQVRGVAKPGGRVVMYDFVRPHGPLFPLLAFYIYGILRLVGRLSALARSDLAPTFRDLPRVIKEAEWDTLLPRRLQEQGIHVMDTQMPFGWVVSGLVGSRAD